MLIFEKYFICVSLIQLSAWKAPMDENNYAVRLFELIVLNILILKFMNVIP